MLRDIIETGFREFTNKVLGSDDIGDDEILTGKLLYKRRTRAFLLQRKVWKDRWFKVEHRVLYCFHDSEYKVLRRSINLKDCIVDDTTSSSHKYYFEVRDCASDCIFQLRASSEEEAAIWISTLKKVSTGVPRPVDALIKQDGIVTNGDNPVTAASDPNNHQAFLTPEQRDRYNFFNAEQQFIHALTDICERLRFVEREARADQLEREQRNLKFLEHRTYLPLCKSTDTWSSILAVLPSEGHAFTTKARCPALMMFELEAHPMKMDVASFLFTDLSVTGELVTPIPPSLTNHDSTAAAAAGDVRMSSKFSRSVSLRDNEERTQSGDGDDLSSISPSIFHAPVKRLSVMALDPVHAGAYQAARHIRDMSFKKAEDELQLGRQVSSPRADDEVVGQDDIELEMEGDAEKATGNDIHDETKAWTTGSESFAEKAARLQRSSQFSNLKNWKLDGLIAKSNDDLRQEVFVIQLISFYEKIFKEANVDVLLYTYQIMSTSKTTGLIQLIPDSISIDALKKQPSWPGSLRGHFEQSYGPDGSPAFEAAMDNYIRSLAGYSIVTYLLALKDRHNGNIMIHRSGQLIHIDFGFVFGLAPGKQFSMEKAPWKFTIELVDVMGGKGSRYYNRYMQLCSDALRVARKHAAKVVSMMEILSYMSNYPAFRYNANAINDFRSRLHMKVSDENLPQLIQKLADRCRNFSIHLS